jgi:hypothetical protein
MTDRYRHLLEGHEAEAARMMDDYLARADSRGRIEQLDSGDASEDDSVLVANLARYFGVRSRDTQVSIRRTLVRMPADLREFRRGQVRIPVCGQVASSLPGSPDARRGRVDHLRQRSARAVVH